MLGLKGVGPKTAARLAEVGLHRLEDVLLFAPRRYDDGGQLIPLARLVAGERAYLRGTVKTAAVRRFFSRGTLEVVLAEGDGEGDATVTLRWFHFRGQVPARFAVGAVVHATGLVRQGKRGLELLQPMAEVDSVGATSVRPRYEKIAGVPGRVIEALCVFAVAAEHDEPRGVPLDLPSLQQAARMLHVLPPEPQGEARAQLLSGCSPAHERLAWETLLLLRLHAMRSAQQIANGVPLPDDPRGRSALLAALPFAPTTAQTRAMQEITRDLAQATPMQRLLTGDVGSGKTLVAAAAIEQCCAAGQRAVLLAPTAILAEQQTAALRRMLPERRVALLHAGISRKERTLLGAQLADPDGSVDVVVGTHALLDDSLCIAKLALLVVDEQQRFGVAARAQLVKSARQRGLVPHQLTLSATPIPRTLALALRGELAVGHLDEKPAGRVAVRTTLHTSQRARAEALSAVRAALGAAGKVYWICTAIGSTDEERGVLEVLPWLERALPGVEVRMCHGRQRVAERVANLTEFRDQAEVLVATTVVEVGLDVPDATLMVIESPQRLGLAQLHQLRGRVGRSAMSGRCQLIAPGLAGRECVRLQRLVAEHDGLAIAEADLALRGMGELAGHAQSGLPSLPPLPTQVLERLALSADAAAREILENDGDLEESRHARLRRALLIDGRRGAASRDGL